MSTILADTITLSTILTNNNFMSTLLYGIVLFHGACVRTPPFSIDRLRFEFLNIFFLTKIAVNLLLDNIINNKPKRPLSLTIQSENTA